VRCSTARCQRQSRRKSHQHTVSTRHSSQRPSQQRTGWSSKLHEPHSLAALSSPAPMTHPTHTPPFRSHSSELSRRILLRSWSRCSSSAPVQKYNHRHPSRLVQLQLRTKSQHTSSLCNTSPSLLCSRHRMIRCTKQPQRQHQQTIQDCRSAPSTPDGDCSRYPGRQLPHHR
jgi:hypothetical protein